MKKNKTHHNAIERRSFLIGAAGVLGFSGLSMASNDPVDPVCPIPKGSPEDQGLPIYPGAIDVWGGRESDFPKTPQGPQSNICDGESTPDFNYHYRVRNVNREVIIAFNRRSLSDLKWLESDAPIMTEFDHKEYCLDLTFKKIESTQTLRMSFTYPDVYLEALLAMKDPSDPIYWDRKYRLEESRNHIDVYLTLWE